MTTTTTTTVAVTTISLFLMENVLYRSVWTGKWSSTSICAEITSRPGISEPNKVLVAFAPVAIESKAAAIKNFYRDVREYFASFHTDDTLSLDQFLEEAESEDSKGFELASSENPEENVMLRIIIRDLIKQVHNINPKYGRILDLICKDFTKGEILAELNLCKSQGYADIKAAQTLARKLYFEN